MRCASRGTGEKLRVSGRIAHVCSVPATDTVRPVTLRQGFATAETTQPAPTVRSAVKGTMEIQPRAPPLIASPARVLGAQAVP